jgi:hypothetical protein
MCGIPGKYDYAIACNASQLGESAIEMRPMMDGQNGKRSVEGTIPKRQTFGGRLYGRGSGWKALPDHPAGGLCRNHTAIFGLIRSRAGAYV